MSEQQLEQHDEETKNFDDDDEWLDDEARDLFDRQTEAQALAEQVKKEAQRETVLEFYKRREAELLSPDKQPDWSVMFDSDDPPEWLEKAKESWNRKQREQLTRETNAYANENEDLDDRLASREPPVSETPWGREAEHREKLARTRLQLQDAVARASALTREDQAALILASDEDRPDLEQKLIEARKHAAQEAPEVKRLQKRLIYLEYAQPFAKLDSIEFAREMVDAERKYLDARARLLQDAEAKARPHAALLAQHEYETALKEWQSRMMADGSRRREAAMAEVERARSERVEQVRAQQQEITRLVEGSRTRKGAE